MSSFTISEGIVLELDDADDHLVAGRHIIYSPRLGYAVVDRHVYVHRLVAGAQPGEIVDHIDGKRLNCRRSNLRLCTSSQNLCNRGKTRANTTGFKGVSFCTQTKRYRAKIKASGKQVHIGRYVLAEDAARAYDAAARRYHGEFARLNFPDNEQQLLTAT